MPTPGPGQVLVRIAAAGLNPLDTKIAAGQAAHAQVQRARGPGPRRRRRRSRPSGRASNGFEVGDEVYGMIGGVGGVQGSLAEYAAVDAALLARKPAAWSMAEAAAVPLSVITAWEGLVDRAGVRRRRHASWSTAAPAASGTWRSSSPRPAAPACGRPGGTARPTSCAGSVRCRSTSSTTPVEELRRASTPAGQGFDIVFDTVGGDEPRPVVPRRQALHRPRREQPRLGHPQPRAPVVPRRHLLRRVHPPPPADRGRARGAHGRILAAAAALGARRAG